MKLLYMYLPATVVAGTFLNQLVSAQTPSAGLSPPMAAAVARIHASLTKDPKAAPPGNYTIDPEHHSIIARPLHAVSYSVLRFAAKQGSLVWDATNPANIKLDVTVSTKPYTEPVEYALKPDAGLFLDSAKYPEARFVSTAVRMVGGNNYEIDGQLTLLGSTKPAQIKASFISVGQNMAGATAIGFSGSMNINWPEFKGSDPLWFGVVPLSLDAEFMKSRTD